jgi:hypothetical protein
VENKSRHIRILWRNPVRRKKLKFNKLPVFLLSLALGIASTAANATVVTVFGAPAPGLVNFNNTVTAAGGTALHDNWANLSGGLSVVRPDYTITRNNGAAIAPTSYGTLSGEVININPAGGPGAASLGSGITMTFNTGINAIGFEVGDWGTCCQPSALYISFNGGTPIQVGMSNVVGDVFFNNKPEVFVGAFDDTNTFTSVQFWGDGVGELLVVGGTVHYALLDQGSLPGDVPEPATLGLLGVGMLGLMAARRRQKS